MNQYDMLWYDTIIYTCTAHALYNIQNCIYTWDPNGAPCFGWKRVCFGWFNLQKLQLLDFATPRPRFWRSKSCHQRKQWETQRLVRFSSDFLCRHVILMNIYVNTLHTSCRHRFLAWSLGTLHGTCGHLFVCTGMFVQCWVSWNATEEHPRGE